MSTPVARTPPPIRKPRTSMPPRHGGDTYSYDNSPATSPRASDSPDSSPTSSPPTSPENTSISSPSDASPNRIPPVPPSRASRTLLALSQPLTLDSDPSTEEDNSELENILYKLFN